jgi:hypothetical protein
MVTCPGSNENEKIFWKKFSRIKIHVNNSPLNDFQAQNLCWKAIFIAFLIFGAETFFFMRLRVVISFK